jgi:hypothetical protein
MMEPLPPTTPTFGIVDLDTEHGLLYLDTATGTTCRLTLVARTERGYPRRELASIPGAVWKRIASAVQKELLRGMDVAEQGPKPPFLRHGDNAIGPLILREVAVIFWSLMEDGEGTHIEALLNGWRQLAREERWWLYARASNPSQRQGQGWRRALYFALTDPADTRTAPRLLEIMEAATAQKKTSPISSPVSYRKVLHQQRTKQRRLQSKAPAQSLCRKSRPATSHASARKTNLKTHQPAGK